MKPMLHSALQNRNSSALLYSFCFFLYLISHSSFAQPSNNDPCNAVAINCGSSAPGTTNGATESSIGNPSCATGTPEDVFYTLFAVPDITYEVTVNGDDYDGVLVAYTGPCDGTLSEIACVDDGLSPGVEEVISFSVDEPQPVLIRTYDWGSTTGSFDLNVSCSLSNTSCADATPFSFGGDPVYGNNTGAGPSGPEMDCAFGEDPLQNVVWYTFFAPTNGTLIIETTFEAGEVTLTDTQIQILDGCSGDVIACDEDGGAGLLSRIELACDDFVQGAQYVLQVDGWNGNTGTFKIETSSGPCPIPENDLCANATSIPVNLPGQCPGNAIEGTTLGSNNEGEVIGGCEPANPDVFYSFNSGSFSDFLLGVNGISATDLVISILEECSGSSIFCTTNPASPAELELTPQTDYLIRVSTNLSFGSPGTFDICLQGVYDCSIFEGNIGDPCNDGNPNTINDEIVEGCSCVGELLPIPENDDCADAQPLTVQLPGNCDGNTTLGTTEGATGSPVDLFLCENGQPDVFYSFNSGPYSEVRINLNAVSALDLVISVFDDCTGTTPIVCNVGVTQSLVVEVEPEQNYILRIHSISGFQGSFNVCVAGIYDCPALEANIGDACDDGNPNTINDVIVPGCSCVGDPVAENDDCANAETISCGDNIEGSTEFSTFDNVAFCGTSNTTPGVWYSFATDVLSDVSINTCTDLPTYDTKISVFSGSCGALECVGGNDDACGLQSTVNFEAQPGEEYLILVHGFGGETGNFFLSVSCTEIFDCPLLGLNIGDPCNDGNPNTINDEIVEGCSCVGELLPIPDNDDCADAQPLTVQLPGNCAGNTTLGTTEGATGSPVDLFLCEEGQPDVFYSFNSGPYSEVRINLNAVSASDLVVSVFDDCAGTTPIVCNIGVTQSLVVEVEPEQNYILRIHSISGFQGSFNVCVAGIYDCPALEANIGDACDDGNSNTINDTVLEGCICAGDIIPDNDECANAEALSVNLPGQCPGNAIVGTTLGSSNEGEVTGDCEPANPDVFYSFNTGDFSTINLNWNAITATDLVVGIYQECTGESIFCTVGLIGSPDVLLEPQTDYLVRISTNLGFGDPGSFDICLQGVYDCPTLSGNIGDACDDGNPNTINDEIVEGCTCEGEPVDGALTVSFDVECTETYTLELYEPGTANLVTTVSGSVNPDNTFTATGLPSGTYDVFVKLTRHLKKGFGNVTVTSGVTSLSGGSFIPGDLNEDNSVNIQDFSAFSAAYGTSLGDPSFNSAADLNCDDQIDIIDFSAFSANFNTDGEEAPL